MVYLPTFGCFYGKCRYVYHTWILWDMRYIFEWLFINRHVSFRGCTPYPSPANPKINSSSTDTLLIQ